MKKYGIKKVNSQNRYISTPRIRSARRKRKTHTNLFIDSDPEAQLFAHICQTPPLAACPWHHKKNRYNGYSDGKETSICSWVPTVGKSHKAILFCAVKGVVRIVDQYNLHSTFFIPHSLFYKILPCKKNSQIPPALKCKLLSPPHPVSIQES